MAKPSALVICFLSFILCFATCYGAPPVAWCLGRPGALEDIQLQQIIDKVCGKWPSDCSPIQPGRECFEPNTVFDHASYCMNIRFQRTSDCDFDDESRLTLQDPSYGNCHYPTKMLHQILA